MRPIQRSPLSRPALDFLAKRTARVSQAPSPAAEAKRLWPLKENKAFTEICDLLGNMASGLSRCMYCEDNEGTDIDHFHPKATYPALAFTWTNYLLACSHCNSNEKRDQFPVDASGAPLLLDPTAEDPFTHLDFVPDTGMFDARTMKGSESRRVFGLDRQTLQDGRRLAWVALLTLLEGYQRAKDAGDGEPAQKLAEVVRQTWRPATGRPSFRATAWAS